ncbi:hypothetical protein [Nocardiopsis sp. YSL2]|uniref:hypothetical protein n=1 Tax=Nocardiopsis sp. YSL2 TaxID=2939492 RepID=UPI0026F4642F|nr:hypothetical protein [Nocardiopsis sp. YSL2]
MSDNPLNMNEVGVACHEQYMGLRKAGFTREEALYLVAAMLSGGPRPPKDEADEGGTP